MTICDSLSHQQSTSEMRAIRANSQMDRVRLLSNQLFPLTNSYTNARGQKIQLWSTPHLQPVGSIRDATGKVSLISPMRIHNPLNPNETPTELYIRLLLSPEDLEWTFSQGSDGSLTIWPRLKAAGWQDAIPVSQDKFNRVNRLLGYVALDKCAKKMCIQIYGQMEQEAA